jgi:hypothetical protein
MLYIHRKLGGLYLLLKRLGAKVPMSELIAPYLNFDWVCVPGLVADQTQKTDKH